LLQRGRPAKASGSDREGPDHAIFFPRARTISKVAYRDAALPLAAPGGLVVTPTIRNNIPQLPFNQLLEADIVYIKDIIHLDNLSDLQIMKLAAIAHFVYNSPDLVARCIIDLQKRNLIAEKSVQAYLQTVR
jgi:hypothetical protein